MSRASTHCLGFVRILFLAVVAVAGLSLASHAQQGQSAPAAAGGIIRGTVVLEGSPVPKLDVVLYVLREGKEETRLFGTTDEQGAFRFDGVKTDRAYTYVVSADYAGVFYHSARLTFTGNDVDKSVELRVAATTTSDENISVARERMKLDHEAGKLRLLTVMEARNTGDKAYIGFQQVGLGRREILKLPLPVAFKNFKVLQGGGLQDVELEDWGGAYTRPFPPGALTLAYQYELRTNAADYSFTRKLPYPIGQFDLVVTDADLRVSATSLNDAGVIEVNNRKVRRLTARNLAAGTTITVSLAGLAPAGFWTKHAGYAYAIIVAIILAGLLIPLASAKRRKIGKKTAAGKVPSPQKGTLKDARSGPGGDGAAAKAAKSPGADGQASEPPKAAQLAERKEALFVELVNLEEAREAGGVDEQEFEIKRDELRRELKEVLYALPRQT